MEIHCKFFWKQSVSFSGNALQTFMYAFGEMHCKLFWKYIVSNPNNKQEMFVKH